MPVKRILTDPDARPPPDPVAAAIRAAALRARKSVTEGYLSAPPSSLVKQAPLPPGPADYPLPARESIRLLFSSPAGTHSPLPSPEKRKRLHDDDVPPSTTPQSLPPLFSPDVMDVDRPMKPLRRSGRIREVSPSPSLFPSQTEMNSHQYEQASANMCSAQLLDSASDNEHR